MNENRYAVTVRTMCRWRNCTAIVDAPLSEVGKALCPHHARKMERLAESDAALELAVGRAIEKEVSNG